MSDLDVRVARPEEFDRVGDITTGAYLHDGFISPDSPYLSTLRDAAARARDAQLLVGVVDGTVIGTVTYCRSDSPWAELAGPGEAEFRMLAVDPRARGRGYGETLVRECIAQAGRDACVVLRLSTEPVMRAAHRIYERIGFARTPERDWRPVPDTALLAYALPL